MAELRVILFLRCEAILRDYDTKHGGPITVNEDTATLINVETNLQNIFSEQQAKFAKVIPKFK